MRADSTPEASLTARITPRAPISKKSTSSEASASKLERDAYFGTVISSCTENRFRARAGRFVRSPDLIFAGGALQEFLFRTSHKPRPLPPGRWVMTQRWNDLLFAHWPVEPSLLAPLLPEWLQVDTYQGSAWLGAVPFWLDRIKIRGVPPVPGARSFPDLNLRTYVRDQFTGTPGIYCFSLDATNLLAVGVARVIYHLPYHWAEMRLEQHSEREFAFYSRRKIARRPVIFKALYRGLGPTHRTAELCSGSFEHFFTERSCVFSQNRAGQPIRASLHYIPWPLEDAEAEIERNDLPASIGIGLPTVEPVLHYSRRLALYIWPAELARPAIAGRPVTVAASPTG